MEWVEKLRINLKAGKIVVNWYYFTPITYNCNFTLVNLTAE